MLSFLVVLCTFGENIAYERIDAAKVYQRAQSCDNIFHMRYGFLRFVMCVIVFSCVFDGKYCFANQD